MFSYNSELFPQSQAHFYKLQHFWPVFNVPWPAPWCWHSPPCVNTHCLHSLLQYFFGCLCLHSSPTHSDLLGGRPGQFTPCSKALGRVQLPSTTQGFVYDLAVLTFPTSSAVLSHLTSCSHTGLFTAPCTLAGVLGPPPHTVGST